MSRKKAEPVLRQCFVLCKACNNRQQFNPNNETGQELAREFTKNHVAHNEILFEMRDDDGSIVEYGKMLLVN